MPCHDAARHDASAGVRLLIYVFAMLMLLPLITPRHAASFDRHDITPLFRY